MSELPKLAQRILSLPGVESLELEPGSSREWCCHLSHGWTTHALGGSGTIIDRSLSVILGFVKGAYEIGSPSRERASEVAESFESRSREDGSSYVCLKEEAPLREEITEAVFATHDGESPNDWRWRICSAAAEALAEDPTGDLQEIADQVGEDLSTVYQSELFLWFAEDPSRLSYVEEAAESLGRQESAIAEMHLGQWFAASGAAAAFLSHLFGG
jgi:hypothetical protein